jgi:hypothetical protein
MPERLAGSRIALVRALADLRRERTPGTVALYAALLATMLLLATVPVCGPVQDRMARAHHARPASLTSWTMFQLVPKMYSFGHRVAFSRAPFTDEPTYSLWSNHYPIRAARYEHGRADLVERREDVYLLLRTGYRGRRWTSRFVLHVDGRQLTLQQLEDNP